jgi:predicted enzyme related to lactoylglutathione lyase
MPNPVVSFEIRGPEPELLYAFYRDVFGWDVFVYGPEYAGVETAAHTHDEATGATTYTGPDAFMNNGVELQDEDGQTGWRYKGETNWRGFSVGVEGGIGRGNPALSFYIQVPHLDATLASVEAHGGVVLQPPTEVAPNVTIASFGDPAGNEVSLILARG